MIALSTSLDGQWVTVRRGREIVLLERGVAPAVGQLTLDSDDVDLAFVGPPAALCVISRTPEPKVVLHAPPYLDAAARIELDQPMTLETVSGPRLVLLSADRKTTVVVRSAGRGLAAQVLDVGGNAVELAVGLERNQVMLSLPKKLEVWDAVSSRPLVRMQIQLPPPPRHVGAAQGHLWATRPGSDEVFIYRLSDGRPFRHYVGAPVEDVVAHPASPLIVLVTPRGLVRLHCFAHSLTVVDSPWTPGVPLALLAAGNDVSLLGLGAADSEPWHVPVGGAGVPIQQGADPAADAEPALATAADRLRSMRERAAAAGGEFSADAQASPQTLPAVHTPSHARTRTWREPLASLGVELARGLDSDIPVVPIDNELGELAHRLGLTVGARRALIALYALYLVGEPRISIARLGQALGDWTEGLGQGDLGALAMLRRKDGRVSLRASVSDLLDGASPHAIRVIGGAATAPRPGASRLPRDGRSDAAIETDLATQLGRIAVIQGAPALALLEARLHGATAVALAAPFARPQPWPREAGLVVVADGGVPAWVAELPAFS